MPELPEVADALRRIRRHVRGRTIVAVAAAHPSIARQLTPAVRRRVVGRVVERLERLGKHQLFHLDDGSVLLVHFRMTGDWAVVQPARDLPDFARAVLTLDNSVRLVLVDPRVLGTIAHHPPGAPPSLDLGPDPLSRAFGGPLLATQLHARRGPLKTVLLDQRVVAGLGNIYVAEALWRAQLAPTRAANTLSRNECEHLATAIQAVLRAAPTGRYWERLSSAQLWQVYDREDEPCPRCHTPIARFTQSARSTYHCPHCQR
jgi:formamidopyrimidine-DNA glycosylase